MGSSVTREWEFTVVLPDWTATHKAAQTDSGPFQPHLCQAIQLSARLLKAMPLRLPRGHPVFWGLQGVGVKGEVAISSLHTGYVPSISA